MCQKVFLQKITLFQRTEDKNSIFQPISLGYMAVSKGAVGLYDCMNDFYSNPI